MLTTHLGQFRLWGKSQAVHRVCPHIAPLAELLGGLGEGHVGCDRRVYHRLGALDTDDAVQISRAVVEEANVDRLHAGRDPGALRLRIDVEDVRLAGENRLFAKGHKGIKATSVWLIKNSI